MYTVQYILPSRTHRSRAAIRFRSHKWYGSL